MMLKEKFYPYSVKKVLEGVFGINDTIFEMRAQIKARYGGEERDNILAYSWQYADEEIRMAFTDTEILLDTIIEDDYIAYISQLGTERTVSLMFMTTEDEAAFQLSELYAEKLAEIWERKGYTCRFCNECIYVGDRTDGGFFFGGHNDHTSSYKLAVVNGRRILINNLGSCWPSYFKRTVSAAQNDRIQEYECLFDPDVEVTSGSGKQKSVCGKGMEYVREYLREHKPVRIIYKKPDERDIYDMRLAAGADNLVIGVNRRNLICEVNTEKLSGEIINDDADYATDPIENIPRISSFEILDHIHMHGCVVELKYDDNTTRNYYFHMYEGYNPDYEWMVDGHRFSYEQFKTARLDSDDNMVFSNGYIIQRHILFFHSYRQAQIEKTGDILYENKGFQIKTLYRTPLTTRLKALWVEQFLGEKEECFGPKKILIDSEGNRIGHLAYATIAEGCLEGRCTRIRVEHTNKYGYLKDDGRWLSPPIYSTAEQYSKKIEKVTCIVDGEEKTFLLDSEGRETPIDDTLEVMRKEEDFINGRCFVNVEEWKGDRVYHGYYYKEEYDIYSDVIPGKWSLIDEDGKKITEPIYFYAVGFWNAGEQHSVVSRFIDGKLCWGLVDLDGNEVIPCKYSDMYSTSLWDGVVAYQVEEDGPYGLMRYDGTVIIEPKFDYIDGFDEEHFLITVGRDSDHLGVYSIDSGKMLLPMEYDCIDYEKRMMECEISYTGKTRYFDYNGKEIEFKDYDDVSMSGEDKISVWKNGKAGVIDFDGNTIIPPVLLNGLEEKLYWEGYLKTGEYHAMGLSRVSGELLVPERYSDIKVRDGFVIASEKVSGGFDVKDTLYAIDGEIALEGHYRNMRLIPENHTLSFESPYGIEYCRINKAIR